MHVLMLAKIDKGIRESITEIKRGTGGVSEGGRDMFIV